jgi:hypothetical protein
MPQVGPITMWVISMTRTPVNGRSGVLIGVSQGVPQNFGLQGK